MAQALVQQLPSDSARIYEQVYRESILTKYGLTDEEMEDNLLYYTTNADQLYRIYDKLATRLENMNFGGATTAPTFTENGDTINLWTASDHLLLLGNGDNRASFTIEADTLLRSGDRVEWHLTSSSIYPEGERNMQASIRVEYADSTSIITRSIGGYGEQTIAIPVSTIRTPQRLHISLLQNTTWSEKPKLLSLSHIYMLRIRPQATTTGPEMANDSIHYPEDSLHHEQKDSLPTSSAAQRTRALTPNRRAIAVQ
ncbi:MAG: DUF4296 domain-containing protein [Bacteroidaceae bacterium]|nr:DUF4296 domain-containing protein [Bacteroidaceae bacterium]